MAWKPERNRAQPSAPTRRRRSSARVSLAGAVQLPADVAPRKRPLQRRSRTTVDAVLQAAADLFSRDGYAHTNTNAIAARAGVSVGSLYQYFPNKDAILTALLERHLQAIDGALATGLDRLGDPRVPLQRAVRDLLVSLQAVHDADPRATRAVEAQVGQLPRIPEPFREREQRYKARLGAALRARHDVRPGPPALMASLLFEIAETAVAWMAHGQDARADPGAALAEAAEAICRYVEDAPPRSR